ncbi:MAG: site-2 protease family protein, partial [Myxococcota bacterium]|nr:site-2 protease family protein [Myxococcota bacterium]
MSILAAVVLIAVLIAIHEFGHFVVAKACGVAVPIFSIGFGRRLLGWYQGRLVFGEIEGPLVSTDYRLSLLPFGGYVKMAGADPFGDGDEDDAELDDPSMAFLRRPVWQRLLVVSAGPAFNLVLPVVVFTLLLI